MRVGAILLAAGLLALGQAAPAAQDSSAPSPPKRILDGTPPVSPEPALDRLVKQAGEAQKAGRLDAAVDAYKKALALKPTWIEGHWALAGLLYDLERYKEARDHFRPVVADRPKDGLAWAMTGLCDVRLKDYEWGLTDLEKAASLGIPNAEVASMVRLQTALLLNHAGNPEAAFQLLQEFATQRKDSPWVIVAFGIAMLRLPLMPEEVPPEKREMVQLAGHGGYHMARGRRTAVGRLALEELVSRYPTEPNVHYAFGVYLAPEEPDAALREFRTELRANPEHFPALLKIASLETRRGNGAEGVAAAEKAVSLQPALPGARLILGRALLEAGNAERAVQELEKGASMAPESGDIQFALARAYQRAGRTEEAARARQEFLKLERASKAQASGPGQREDAYGGSADTQGGPN
jgi:predicted Zn-dependent protease